MGLEIEEKTVRRARYKSEYFIANVSNEDDNFNYEIKKDIEYGVEELKEMSIDLSTAIAHYESRIKNVDPKWVTKGKIIKELSESSDVPSFIKEKNKGRMQTFS